ncbi:MAG: hypothetical protein VKJ46_15180 [Leptolyngbyaceae bacterium]|nr:hypothetical protein [Leptolyngbyaceae bacterium]
MSAAHDSSLLCDQASPRLGLLQLSVALAIQIEAVQTVSHIQKI